MLTQRDILKVIGDKRSFIQREFDVDKIALFGSYAKDKQTDSSDIDFYVTLKEKNLDNMTGLWLFLEKTFDKKIDLLYYHAKLRKGLKKQIEEEAIYA